MGPAVVKPGWRCCLPEPFWRLGITPENMQVFIDVGEGLRARPPGCSPCMTPEQVASNAKAYVVAWNAEQTLAPWKYVLDSKREEMKITKLTTFIVPAPRWCSRSKPTR